MGPAEAPPTEFELQAHPIPAPNSDSRSQKKAQEELLSLFNQAKQGEIILLVQDEILVNIVGTQTRTWLPKGSKIPKFPVPKLKAGPNERVAVFGALNVLTGQCHRFYASRINKLTFLRYLKRIAQYYRQITPDTPVCLVIDGHSAHTAKKVTQWLSNQIQLQFYRLPKNSPELNPIEYFWRHLRREVTHIRPYKSLRALKLALTQFFSRCWREGPAIQQWVYNLTEKIWTSNNLISQVA